MKLRGLSDLWAVSLRTKADLSVLQEESMKRICKQCGRDANRKSADFLYLTPDGEVWVCGPKCLNQVQ